MSKIKLLFAMALFVTALVSTKIVGAAGCAQHSDSIRSDGKTWRCKLASEGINECTYYNDSLHCKPIGTSGPGPILE